MAAIYRVGDRVDGLYDENSDDMWYPGRIRCVHAGEAEPDSADGPTFEVLYDDGEVETHVRPEFLRQHVPGTICVGTRVLCRYDGGEEYYPGQVSDVQENGRYTIAYDDGEVEEDVPLAHILEPKEEEKDEAEAAGAADEEEQEKTPNDVEPEQQQEEDENDEKDAEMEEAQKSPNNPAEDTFSGADVAQENEESVNGDDKSDEPVTAETSDQFDHPRPEQPKHNEAFPQAAKMKSFPTLLLRECLLSARTLLNRSSYWRSDWVTRHLPSRFSQRWSSRCVHIPKSQPIWFTNMAASV